MKLLKLAACVASASLLVACGSDSDDNNSTTAFNMENAEKVINTNADIAFAAYSDSLATAVALETALTALEENPNAETLEAAKTAWLVSREPYGQTEVYRFRPTPIEDDYTTAEEGDGPEGDLNAWPLGEALIDYVVTNATDFTSDQVGVVSNGAGVNDDGEVDGSEATQNIIGTSSITINAALLANTATAEDEHDVIAGYHAIEFLLWGQDLNEDKTATESSDRTNAVNTGANGGQRPISDFETDSADANANKLAERRHQYLAAAVDKLIADLTTVRNQWAEGNPNNYRAEFTTLTSEADAKTKIEEILTGMGTLSEGELAGERMKIALINNSQEDEHSCFSDNTHRDIWLNAEGVSNSYYGEYAGYDHDLNPTTANTSVAGAVDGYGIHDYLADAGLETLAANVKTTFDNTEVKYTAIDTQARAGNPFDVLIMEGATANNAFVKETIVALNTQANAIQVIADDLGLGDVVDDEASACDTSSGDAVAGEEC